MYSRRLEALSRLCFVLGFPGTAVAQVFDTGASGVPPLVYPPPAGLSQPCNATFDTPINCSPMLPMIAWEGYFPSVNDLRSLCKTTCLQSLESFRSKQLDSCKSDIMTVAGSAYPATYNVDYFMFTYNFTCRTDKYASRSRLMTIMYLPCQENQ